MRTMYDGISGDAARIARAAKAGNLVGYYVDGLYKWSSAQLALLAPGIIRVPIAVFHTTNAGIILDCEPGNCTPVQSVDWVIMRRRAGVDPTVYCNQLDTITGWPAVRAAFKARNVPEPHYWVAKYDNVQVIPAGAIGKQYTDNEAAGYDLSVVADYWPGVDPPKEENMAITDADAQKIADVTSSTIRNKELGQVDLAGNPTGTKLSLGMMIAERRASDHQLLQAIQAITPGQIDPVAVANSLAGNQSFIDKLAASLAGHFKIS